MFQLALICNIVGDDAVTDAIKVEDMIKDVMEVYGCEVEKLTLEQIEDEEG